METPVPIEQASLPVETEISERQQQILGCVACISDGGNLYATEANRQIASCTELAPSRVSYDLRALGAQGLVAIQPRSKPARPGLIGPSLNEHTITETGQLQLPKDWQPCAKQATSGDPFVNLTKLQARFIDCVSCLTARGIDPTSLDIATCTSRTVDTTTAMLNKFVQQGLLVKDIPANRPRKQGGKAPLRYVPTAAAQPHMPKPPSILDCRQFNKEAEVLYASFTDQQRRILGCTACLVSKARRKELSGATNALIANCQDIPSRTVIEATTRFVELGALEAESGYSQSAKRNILTPTQLGRKLFTITTLADTCATNLTEADRQIVHLEKAVAKCIGCIWTKQLATEEKPAALTSMVSHCSGIALKSVQAVTKRMVDEGKLKRTITPVHALFGNKQPTIAYAPPAYLRALPPVGGRRCKLPLYTNIPDHFLRPITTDILKTPPRDNAAATYNSPWFRKNLDHRTLSRKEEATLARIMQNEDDPQAAAAALDTFILHNFKLAVWAVHQQPAERIFLPFQDALQVAQRAIVKAAKRFDPERGLKFSTYAVYWTRQNLQRAAADYIDVPVEDYMFFGKIYHVISNFKTQYHRFPSVVEIARELQIKPKQVDRILQRRQHAVNTLSMRLDSFVESGESNTTFHELVGEEDAGMARVEASTSIERLKSYLSPVENDFLENAVQDLGLTANSITTKYGMLRNNGERIRNRIGSLLRHPYFGILATLDSSFDWQEEAACSNLQYDGVVRKVSGTVANQTKAVCQACPVKQECESFAKNAVPPVTTGIWGGKTAASLLAANAS